jgi:hypothetical protein
MKKRVVLWLIVGIALGLGAGSACAAAVPFLEYNFNDGTTGSVASFSVALDVTGHSYDAYLVANGSGLYKVASPVRSGGTNYAIRWPANGDTSYSYSAANVPNPATTFPTGVSVRAVISVDAFLPDGAYAYHRIAHLRWSATGTPLFGFQYATFDKTYLEVINTTTSGVADILVPLSAIETKLHVAPGGLAGKPLVLVMSWSPAISNLATYVNGEMVTNLTANYLADPLGSTSADSFVVGGQKYAVNGSRAGVIDEVKVWSGALTADEVMADYRVLFPPQGTVIAVH